MRELAPRTLMLDRRACVFCDDFLITCTPSNHT